jgi:hypothetical protein
MSALIPYLWEIVIVWAAVIVAAWIIIKIVDWIDND